MFCYRRAMVGRTRGPVVSLVLLAAVACGGTTSSELAPAGGDVPAADAGPSDARADTSSRPDGSIASIASCTHPGECALAVPGCCGYTCGELTASSLVAVRRGTQAELKASTCDDQGGMTTCPGCVSGQPPASLQAMCRAGTCAVVDVASDALSACSADGDCALRPATCCACGLVDAANLVALATGSVSDYGSAICDPAQPCGKCAWEIPTSARARCGATKHCEVAPP